MTSFGRAGFRNKEQGTGGSVDAILPKDEQIAHYEVVDANVFETDNAACLCLQRLDKCVHRGIGSERDTKQSVTADLGLDTCRASDNSIYIGRSDVRGNQALGLVVGAPAVDYHCECDKSRRPTGHDRHKSYHDHNCCNYATSRDGLARATLDLLMCRRTLVFSAPRSTLRTEAVDERRRALTERYAVVGLRLPRPDGSGPLIIVGDVCGIDASPVRGRP